MTDDVDTADIIDWRGPSKQRVLETEAHLREEVRRLQEQLRLERSLAEKLQAELHDQCKELLQARAETAAAQAQVIQAQWALLGVRVLPGAQG